MKIIKKMLFFMFTMWLMSVILYYICLPHFKEAEQKVFYKYQALEDIKEDTLRRGGDIYGSKNDFITEYGFNQYFDFDGIKY